MSLLMRIKAAGGSVSRDRWRLKLKRGRLSNEAVAWIKANRNRVMAELWPAFDAWEERAAIREYDGGQSRQEAEAAAYAEVEPC